MDLSAGLDARTIVLYNFDHIMNLWDRLLDLLRRLPGARPTRFEMDAPLHAALTQRAGLEQVPLAQVQEGLLADGLVRLESADQLKRRWDTLTGREQDVTALCCLGYTNRQMAAYLRLATATIKGYLTHALAKWDLHSKSELRMVLKDWDFSDWAPPAR